MHLLHHVLVGAPVTVIVKPLIVTWAVDWAAVVVAGMIILFSFLPLRLVYADSLLPAMWHSMDPVKQHQELIFTWSRREIFGDTEYTWGGRPRAPVVTNTYTPACWCLCRLAIMLLTLHVCSSHKLFSPRFSRRHQHACAFLASAQPVTMLSVLIFCCAYLD